VGLKSRAKSSIETLDRGRIPCALDPATRNPVWKEPPVTRALRSQELWLTLTYLGLLLLMAKGFAS
jgi:hypothetical protein